MTHTPLSNYCKAPILKGNFYPYCSKCNEQCGTLAEPTPTSVREKELREDEVERLSSIFHDIYQKEAHRQEDAGIGKARHYDEYEKLSEPVKEFDRVLARYVLSLLHSELERKASLIEGLKTKELYIGETQYRHYKGNVDWVYNDAIDSALTIIREG